MEEIIIFKSKNEMEIYIIIIVGFVCTLIPTLITLWLNEKVKGSVKNSFDKKLEDLKKEHSIEISKFQTELNSLKSKENFKFTKLHEKRLEVLQKTYQYINETSESLKLYVTPLKTIILGDTNVETEKILSQDFIRIVDEFTRYFNYNRIYFDEVIEKLLEDFFKESVLIFATYHQNKSDNDSIYSSKEIQKILTPIKKQIEIKFRELLGE